MRSTETLGDPAAFDVLGEGSRRKCYRLPGRDACVKFYRLPSEYTHKTTPGVRLHIWLARHTPALNVCCQEYRYHRKLRGAVPQDLFAVFPESIEPVYLASHGWGIVESLIVNFDGTPMRRVIAEIALSRDPVLRRRLLEEAERLFARLADHAVCFYDPPNLMVQWTAPGAFRLRVVDFEPKGRALIPGLSSIKPYVRSKVRRRCARYLVRLRAACLAEPLKPAPAAAPAAAKT
jgi:hypothetical protein